MKKFKLYLAIIMCLLMIPFTVFADEADTDSKDEATTEEKDTKSEDSKKVKIYFFRGEGCPHCAEAEEFFDSIKDEYGEYYTIVDYETWYNTENADLLQKVGKARDEEISGVPYILIGNKSWSGYSSDMNDEIISTIKSEYEKDVADRYDIMKLIATGSTKAKEKIKSSDVMALIIVLIVVAGISYGIVVARKKTV